MIDLRSASYIGLIRKYGQVVIGYNMILPLRIYNISCEMDTQTISEDQQAQYQVSGSILFKSDEIFKSLLLHLY